MRRRRQPGDRQGDDLHDVAGAARAPHAVCDRRGASRAPDPDRLARHRRGLRQQGADLPGLRRRDRGVAPHRPAGEVDRGPLRQPDLDRLRPRLPHARRAGDQGRPHDRPARVAPLRQRRVLRRRPAEPLQGRAVPHLHGLLRHPRGARHRGRRLHEQGPRRRRLPVLVPGHRGVVPHRAPRADGGVRARRRPGRLPDAELHQAGAVPVHVGDRVRVRLRRLRQGARPGAREARLHGAAKGAGGGARPRAG